MAAERVETFSVDEWVSIRNAIAKRLEGGLIPTGVAYRSNAEKLMQAGFIDNAAVLASLVPSDG